MVPLQIILLLLLVRLPRTMQIGSPGSAALTAPLVQLPPAIVWLSFIAANVALVALVLQRAVSALRMLNEPSASGVAVAARTDALFQRARWATIGITAAFIYGLGLPAAVEGAMGTARNIPLLPETLYLIPPLLAWIAFWFAAYRIESAIHQRSLPFRFAAAIPAHPMPTLGQFMAMQMRHNFYLLIPAGAIMLMEEESIWLDSRFPHAGDCGIFLAVAGLIVLMPWYMTWAWGTAPLTGPLRRRLDGVAKKYRLRFRNILVWKTHHAITNAAIVGYLPFARYFLMTDALLETLTDKQIEAVFAHEVGHGVHRHLWWYLLGVISALVLSSGVSDIAMAHLPAKWLSDIGGFDAAGSLMGLVIVAAFIGGGFPFISRRFEHQADWFAARHMAAMTPSGAAEDELFEAALPAALYVEQPVGAGHDPRQAGPLVPAPAITFTQYVAGQYPHAAGTGISGNAAPGAAGPSPQASADNAATPSAVAGAEVFISALDAIADLAHRSRERRGWMHPSVHQRMNLLRQLAVDATARKHFERRMTMTRMYLVGLVVLTIGVTAYDLRHPLLIPVDGGAQPRSVWREPAQNLTVQRPSFPPPHGAPVPISGRSAPSAAPASLLAAPVASA